jgi:hypothetical protein
MLCVNNDIGSGRNANIHNNCLMLLSKKYGVFYIILGRSPRFFFVRSKLII